MTQPNLNAASRSLLSRLGQRTSALIAFVVGRWSDAEAVDVVLIGPDGADADQAADVRSIDECAVTEVYVVLSGHGDNIPRNCHFVGDRSSDACLATH